MCTPLTFDRIRNEIQPNLMTLSPFLLPRDGRVPRQYLDKATVEQAEELATLYLAMDAQVWNLELNYSRFDGKFLYWRSGTNSIVN
jgi:hypothetical protein